MFLGDIGLGQGRGARGSTISFHLQCKGRGSWGTTSQDGHTLFGHLGAKHSLDLLLSMASSSSVGFRGGPTGDSKPEKCFWSGRWKYWGVLLRNSREKTYIFTDTMMTPKLFSLYTVKFLMQCLLLPLILNACLLVEESLYSTKDRSNI